MSRFNKATAAAVVSVAAWLASLAGLHVPDPVQASLVTIAVALIPNVDRRPDDRVEF